MAEKKCKHCAMAISEAAKVCPYCRKKVGMSLLVKFFLVILGLGLLASITTPKYSSLRASGRCKKAPTDNKERCSRMAGISEAPCGSKKTGDRDRQGVKSPRGEADERPEEGLCEEV